MLQWITLNLTMKKIIIAVLISMLAGCSQAPTNNSKYLRIISTAPNITEILFALGLDEEIVGVSSFCNYPAKAQKKSKIGDFSNPNIERLIALRPDIVFTTSLEQAAINAKLKKLGLTTVTIYPKSIEELFRSIKDIGTLTGRENEAENLIADMSSEIDSIREKVADIPTESRKRLLIEMLDDPLIVASKSSFVGELGTIAGGDNIAFDTEKAYSKFSPELVISRNPDCIIMGYMFGAENALDKVRERAGYSNINAVNKNAVFNDISPDVLLRPGPRATEAIEEIYKRLYER